MPTVSFAGADHYCNDECLSGIKAFCVHGTIYMHGRCSTHIGLVAQRYNYIYARAALCNIHCNDIVTPSPYVHMHQYVALVKVDCAVVQCYLLRPCCLLHFCLPCFPFKGIAISSIRTSPFTTHLCALQNTLRTCTVLHTLLCCAKGIFEEVRS